MRVTVLLTVVLAASSCGGDDSDPVVTGSSMTEADSMSGGTADASEASTVSSATSGPGSATSNDSADPTTGETGQDSSGDPSAGSTDSETTASGTATTSGGQDEFPPVDDADALLAWLEEGNYLAWDAESSVHPSDGPHGDVRTYLNDTLVSSLSAGNAEHQQGSAAVKELYGNGVVTGYAVAVKTASGAAGDTWYWYEVISGSVVADGNGVGLCTGCHSGGSDYVLTPFPLQ